MTFSQEPRFTYSFVLTGFPILVIPILNGLGRAFVVWCFPALTIYTAELYATNVCLQSYQFLPEFIVTYPSPILAELFQFQMRVSAVGLGSSFARVGGAIAPYIALSVSQSTLCQHQSMDLTL